MSQSIVLQLVLYILRHVTYEFSLNLSRSACFHHCQAKRKGQVKSDLFTNAESRRVNVKEEKVFGIKTYVLFNTNTFILLLLCISSQTYSQTNFWRVTTNYLSIEKNPPALLRFEPGTSHSKFRTTSLFNYIVKTN